jgi:hypothetical protein
MLRGAFDFSLLISVFKPKNEVSAVLLGYQPGKQSRPDTADV